MMIIDDPTDPDYSEILALLYDLSSRIKLPIPFLGADTLDAVINIIAQMTPGLLSPVILALLPGLINPILGKDTQIF